MPLVATALLLAVQPARSIAAAPLVVAVLRDHAIPERFAEVVPPVEPLVRSLHVVGKQDTMNPPAQAMRVAEAFFCAELLEHPGGHIVPMDERAMKAYVDVMR